MKRFKLFIVGLGIVLVAVAGFSSAASAQEDHSETPEATTTSEEPAAEAEAIHHIEEIAEENGASEFDRHCIEILAEGGTVDDCQAAPNQLLPELNELIFGGAAFFIVFGFITWKGLPTIKKGMQARTDRIQGDLDAAEAQKTEAAEVLAQYQAQLADARTESARIIEEARSAADDVRANLQAKADADIAEQRAKAAADIEAAKAQAVADLRGEVAALAIGAAEQVVERSLDEATNVALVESYIESVGANS